MVTSPEPVLVSVTVLDAEVPTVMATAMATAVPLRNIVVVTPLPDSITTVVPLGAVHATVTLSDPTRRSSDLNVTEKVKLGPAAMVMGRVRGLALKPAPVTLGC